ncbi:MAG: hypothetical protein HYZ50_10345 [Deltaproteobacteria bacterium]|nr:hypothetical protein [Deltaproteobacteria bacterium]
MNKFFLAGLLSLLSACAVAPNAYLHQAKLQNHDFLATDARLRVIAETELAAFSTTGSVDPKRIVCTEPSPDVATTLASSLGIGVSVLGYGTGSISTQQVEGLVQLAERTAAIQLLRDKMYQSCLAYANGAISSTTYSLIMSRLDDAIVTLSLGDSAAGAFGRKLAGLGGEATAKADAALVGLPNEISKIEEQAGKLAAANKKVDTTEKALRDHKANSPEEGKETEHQALTAKLEEDLANAKSERDALLELMRSSAKTASEATGKISQVQTGGGLTAKPDADALQEMQADFLLTDASREVISACLVELGFRAGGEKDPEELKLVSHLESMFLANPQAFGSDYVAGVMRTRNSSLAQFCWKNLPDLIPKAAKQFHEYRLERARLNAEAKMARYAGDVAKARQTLMDATKMCKTDFKDDAKRQKACLDQVIPLAPAADDGQ